MKKVGTLTKVLEFNALATELSATFGVDKERLFTTVQVVLECASEGQNEGFKAAKKAAPKSKPKPKKPELVVADRPPLKEAMVRVMGTPGNVFAIKEIVEILQKRGWMPPSKNPARYVGFVLITNKNLFAPVKNKGRGFWTTTANAFSIVTMPKATAPAKAPASKLAKEMKGSKISKEALSAAGHQATINALVTNKKLHGERFGTGALMQASGQDRQTCLDTLFTLWTNESGISKRGKDQWHVADRDLVRMTLRSAQNGATVNGVAHH